MTDTRITHNLDVQYVPLDQLQTYPGNARRGDVDAIADSMDENGVFSPIVVQRSTGYVIDGNHRYLAMQQMGEDAAPVVYVDVDDERAKRIVLAANRTNDLATYDEQALVDLLASLPDLDGTGYSDDDLTDLLESLDAETAWDGNLDREPRDHEDEGEGGSAADDATVPKSSPHTGTLVDKFGAPPFTVIDTRSGYWQARRRTWTGLGIESELGREGALLFAAAVSLYSNWYDVKSRAEEDAGRKLSEAEVIEGPWAQHLVQFKDGKQTTSVFDPALCELLYRWHTIEGDRVLDPWAGGSVRGVVAGALGRAYYGAELRPEQVEANRSQAHIVNDAATPEAKVAPVWEPGDSTTTLTRSTEAEFDFLIGCPPYYDLEVYSDNPEDLSTMAPAEFDKAMHRNIAAAATRLRNDRFAAVVVSAVRGKDGLLLDMRKLMIEAFAAAGMGFINDCILMNVAGTAAIRATRSFQGARTITRVHQEVLIFVKGDRKAAAKRLGDLDIGATLAAAAAVDSDEDEDGLEEAA